MIATYIDEYNIRLSIISEGWYIYGDENIQTQKFYFDHSDIRLDCIVNKKLVINEFYREIYAKLKDAKESDYWNQEGTWYTDDIQLTSQILSSYLGYTIDEQS
jgi:hypothetical protein